MDEKKLIAVIGHELILRLLELVEDGWDDGDKEIIAIEKALGVKLKPRKKEKRLYPDGTID